MNVPTSQLYFGFTLITIWDSYYYPVPKGGLQEVWIGTFHEGME